MCNMVNILIVVVSASGAVASAICAKMCHRKATELSQKLKAEAETAVVQLIARQTTNVATDKDDFKYRNYVADLILLQAKIFQFNAYKNPGVLHAVTCHLRALIAYNDSGLHGIVGDVESMIASLAAVS